MQAQSTALAFDPSTFLALPLVVFGGAGLSTRSTRRSTRLLEQDLTAGRGQPVDPAFDRVDDEHAFGQR